MSIVGIANERPDSPEASFDMGKHVITRRFIVNTSSVNDGPVQVANAIGIPYMFQPYYFGAEFHPYCRVRSITPKRIRPASLQWEVTVVYETPEAKGGGGGPGSDSHDGGDKAGTGVDNPNEYENPLLEIPELESHFETQQQPVYGCLGAGFQCAATKGQPTLTPSTGVGSPFFTVGDGVVVSGVSLIANMSYGGIIQNVGPSLSTTIQSINATTGVITLAANWTGPSGNVVLMNTKFRPPQASNLEPFNPPPTMDSSRLILTVTRNEPLVAPHPALSIAYQDAVNSDQFWGADPGCVKINNITVRRETRQITGGTTVAFLRCTYVFHFKGTWDIQLLDKGSWYWTQPAQSQNGTGPQPQKERFQTDDGQPLDFGLLDGSGHKLTDGAAPVFLMIRPYNWKPFTALNLPQAFSQVQ